MQFALLGEVAEFIRGVTFKPDELVEFGSQDSFVCMRTKNVQKYLDESDLISVPKKCVKNATKILKEGDLLVSTANSFELVGKACWVPALSYPATAGGFISILRADTKKIYPRYLYHWVRFGPTQYALRYCGRKTTNISNMDFGQAKELRIPLPPLKEQKRIAAILDKADAMRRKRQQAIDLTDQFLRSVFLDMFGDPVTNPKGWEICPLSSAIAHANNGLSRRRKTFENIGDIVLRLQDVHYDGIRFEKDLNRILLDDKEKLRYKLDDNDILFIRVNGNPEYVGRSAVFHEYVEDVYHNDHIIRIKLSEAYVADFLCYLLNYPGSRNIISTQIKTSAGQHTISQGGIEKLMFYRPPVELQEKFAVIRSRIKKLPYELKGAESLFGSLTQKAFNGKLTKHSEAA